MKIETLFDNTTIALMQSAPEGLTVRGLILAKVNLWPPVELKTFEELKTWLEKETAILTQPDMTFGAVPQPVPLPPPRPAINFRVSVTETEYGTCQYVSSLSGSGNIAVPLNEIENIAENSSSFEGFYERLTEYIENEASDSIETSSDDCSYENYNSEDTEDRSVEFNYRSVREQALELLRQHNPELANRLTE